MQHIIIAIPGRSNFKINAQVITVTTSWLSLSFTFAILRQMIKGDEAAESNSVLEVIGELEDEEMVQKEEKNKVLKEDTAVEWQWIQIMLTICPRVVTLALCISLVYVWPVNIFCISLFSTELLFWVLFMFDIFSDLDLEIRTLADLSELSRSGMKIIFTGVSLSLGFSVMLFLLEESPFDYISQCMCLVGENMVFILFWYFFTLDPDVWYHNAAITFVTVGTILPLITRYLHLKYQKGKKNISSRD